jgi:isochorismate hydrolase
MNLLIIQFPPMSRYFVSLWTKNSPQHPVLEHPQSMFHYLVYISVILGLSVTRKNTDERCLRTKYWASK